MGVQDKPMELTEVFNEKEFKTLQDMILFYKEFQSELYDYPEENTLFTETQRKLFSAFDIASF
jgi:hypothetical protein